MQKKSIISFPHIGNYHIEIKLLLKLLFKDSIVMPPPRITKKTIELGAKHSPDLVCLPFKYNLGCFIEALEKGADILFQGGGGCRYGYYAELQEEILRDLGYEFKFIRLFNNNENMNVFKFYKNIKNAGCSASLPETAYYLLLIIRAIKYQDILEKYMRENIGFESEAGSFDNVMKQFYTQMEFVKNFSALNKIYKTASKLLHALPVNKPADCYKVVLVGELYSLMEPFSSCFIEKELAKNNIMVSRFTNVTYLLFEKTKKVKEVLKDADGYLKYELGADGTETVAHSVKLAKEGYDGIIHLKPFGCMPEINAMPILQKINRDFNIPVLYFSFDALTSETGIKTRLEAFYDMLKMRKKLNNE